MRTTIFAILILLASVGAHADQWQLFTNGDEIDGGTFNESGNFYTINAGAFISLADLSTGIWPNDRWDEAITLTYQRWTGGEWAPTARTDWLTEEQVRAGDGWYNVNNYKMFFPANASTIRNVEVWVARRDSPIVPNTLATVGALKARF